MQNVTNLSLIWYIKESIVLSISFNSAIKNILYFETKMHVFVSSVTFVNKVVLLQKKQVQLIFSILSKNIWEKVNSEKAGANIKSVAYALKYWK